MPEILHNGQATPMVEITPNGDTHPRRHPSANLATRLHSPRAHPQAARSM